MSLMIPLEFFIYSFFGWVCECIYCSLPKRKWINRGMLKGPYCPIYGVGSLFIIKLLSPFENKPLLVFVLGIIITSLLEYVTSYLLEVLFHTKWWDYKERFMNLNGRICLKNSLLFGLLGLVVIYLVHPKVESFLIAVPSYGKVIILSGLITLFIIDLFTTIKVLIKDSREIKELEAILLHYFSKNKYDSKSSLKEDLQRILDLLPFDMQMSELLSEIKRRYNEFLEKNTITRKHLRNAYPNAIIGKKNISSIIKMIIENFKNDNHNDEN